jgi:hypothetical protein
LEKSWLKKLSQDSSDAFLALSQLFNESGKVGVIEIETS